MSKQLAISACISILAMAGLALAAPGITDHAPITAHAETGHAETAHAETGAATMIAAPAFTN